MHYKIIDCVIENCVRLARDFKLRVALRLARELFSDQMLMIQIQMNVTTHPHQFAGFEASLLRDHPLQQSR